MSCEDMIKKMNEMPNGERINFLLYLSEQHFHGIELSDEEMELIEAYRAGELKGVLEDE